MRDRLGHLHQVQTDSEGFSTVELDTWSEAVASRDQDQNQNQDQDQDQVLDQVLNEAQQIRQEILQIHNDISELKDVNYQTLNSVAFPADTKRDANAVGADIKRRAEAVLQRLHLMDARRAELEAQRGGGDPAARIARTQYQCLGGALREAMCSYNDAEVDHRGRCRRRIQRSMEVVGVEVGGQEVEELMERGELNVFTVQVEGKTAQSAMLEIQSRHKDLTELETRIRLIQELFLDVAVLTKEQEVVTENIQKHVEDSAGAVQDGVERLERATRSDNNNPFKKMFCWCFPCFNN